MESTIEDVVNTVERFRILCVGKAGVGKSSLINCIFGTQFDVQKAPVAHWTVGPANIETELISDENKFVVVHDSMGFEPGNAKTFNIAHKFITERRNKSLPLKDQLHALWLCTETPVAGGRVEAGDENLLQLAQQTDTPVVVVFTKYDLLIRTKMAELRNDEPDLSSDDLDKRAEEEAQKVFDTSVDALHEAIRKMDSTMPMPTSTKVSTIKNYGSDISSLVEMTRDVIQDKLRAKVYVDTMFTIAQRVDPQSKIDNSSAISKAYYRRPTISELLLRDALAGAHRSITTCWNFNDKTGILSGTPFKQLMLYLVQDVRESLDCGSYTRSSAIDQISHFLSQATTDSTVLPPKVPDSLERTLLQDEPQIQVLFIAYTVDLTRVLTSLFGIINAQTSPSSGITWSDLKRAFDVYNDDGSLKRIHSHICQIYERDKQILDPRDRDNPLRVFDVLLKDGLQAPPKPSPGPQPKTAQVPKTTPTLGSASNSEQVAVSNTVPASGTNPAIAVQPVEEAVRQSSWRGLRSRICPCLAPQRS